MKILGKELLFNNNNVYHTGNKPIANDIRFTDGKTFQQKLDEGSLKGATGATGAKGDKGLAGDKGATGSQGPQGTPGATGATGAKGATGDRGATGAQGPTGSAGTNGFTWRPTVDGGGNISWANNGSGSAPVATNIRGPQGGTGATGPQGTPGPQGATGAKGATGATGPQGPAGLTTAITVNGTKYSQSSGNITLPNYPSLSNLGSASTVDTFTIKKALKMGSYANTFIPFDFFRANTNTGNCSMGIGIGEVKVKKESSTASYNSVAGMIGVCEKGSTDVVGRIEICNGIFKPQTDNKMYNGCTSNRWIRVYAVNGAIATAYAPALFTNKLTKNNKKAVYTLQEKKSMNIVADLIKNTYIYHIPAQTNRNIQEEIGIEDPISRNTLTVDYSSIEYSNPTLFSTFGEKREDGNYDISDVGKSNFLWAGLQQALINNDELRQIISKLETRITNLETLTK